MKTLVLIRHATADNKKISQQDSDRNLNELGQLQAKNIAEQLQEKNCLPDYLLCSPTNRTLQTATCLCQTLKLNPDKLLETDDILYTGCLEEILSNLCKLTTAPEHLFVIGHNLTITYLAHRLCRPSKTITLPPAGVIGLEFAIKSWHEVSKTQGKLLFFIEPDHASN